MAARSFLVDIQNWTGTHFSLVEKHLDHGQWPDNDSATPPAKIPVFQPGETGYPLPGQCSFSSESDGFATGTQGGCTYKSDKGDLSINWDNPFSGSNSFSASAPSEFRLVWGNISGDNASVILEIIHVAP